MNIQPNEAIGELFFSAVEKYGPRPLIISDIDDSIFTFSEAGEVVGALILKLQAAGLKKGDCVATCCSFHPEAIFTFWACMSMGLVFIPLDHRLPPTAVDKIISLVKPKLLFVDKKRIDVSRTEPGLETIVLDDNSFSSPQGQLFSEWISDLEAEDKLGKLPALSSEDIGVVIFTSGTTGKPKGVKLSHGALYRSGHVVGDVYQWKNTDILLNLGELHAVSGLRNPCIASLHTGLAVICCSEDVRSNLFSITNCIKRNRATILATSPALMRQLVEQKKRLGPKALSTLRMALSTGSEIWKDTVRGFVNHYNVPLYNYYGLTETTGICSAIPVDSSRMISKTVGVPVGCTIQIVDSAGEPVETGETGEIKVSNGNIMNGYWDDPKGTKAVLRGGCFYTGDLASMDQEGFIDLKGRKGDSINNAHGDLIHPSEIENSMMLANLLRDVGVCGFVSSHGDERLAAFIIPKENNPNKESLFKQLRDHVSSELGAHKIPAVIKIITEIPRDNLGSLLRRELKKKLQ